MKQGHNQCAGPFGAVYASYIERPWLAAAIGRAVWGIDVRPMYRSMAALAEIADGETVVDVPCGGGVALRALSPEQRLAYVGIDIDDEMLSRTTRRAARRGLAQVRTIAGDMRAIPLDDAVADVVCCYSGLHMIDEPRQALAECVRVLRPGGRLVGATFVAGGSRRQRWLLAAEERRGAAARPFGLNELRAWLTDADLVEVTAAGRGFAVFSAAKPQVSPA